MGTSGASSSGSLGEISQLRLTTDSGSAILEKDAGAGVTTLYLAPHKGNKILLPDTAGTWAVRTCPQTAPPAPSGVAPSLSLASLGNGDARDVLARWNSGAIELDLGPSWGSTNRSGTLGWNNEVGVYTSSPASFGGTSYLVIGSVYGTAAGQTRDDPTVGRFVSNRFNRLRRLVGQAKGAGTWNETSGTYVRPNGSAAWTQLQWLDGLEASGNGAPGNGSFEAWFALRIFGNAMASQCFAGIGHQGASIHARCQSAVYTIGSGAGDGALIHARLNTACSGVGVQTLYALVRFTGGGGTQQFSGDAVPAESSGLWAFVEV